MALSYYLIVTLVIYILYNKISQWHRRRKKLVEAIEKLPGPPNIPLPIVNHSLVILYLDSLKHHMGTFALTYHMLSNMRQLFPDEGICRFWLGWKPIVMLYSPENVESILTSTSVINKADEYRFFEPWIGEGLVTSKQKKWHFRRKILTPAFHFRILNDFLPIINEEASKLVKKLNQPKYLECHKSLGFDITPLVTLCTLDTICETAMGININCQDDEESEYVRALYEVAEMALSRVTRPWLWPDLIFKFTKNGRRFNEAKNIMHDFSKRVILERKTEWERQLQKDRPIKGENSTREPFAEMTIDDLRSSSFFKSSNKRLAFLDLLLHQHLIAKTMTLDDVREEVDTFMFAGHDTTAMSISWTIYMLGLHVDIQDKIRHELDKVLGPINLNGDESLNEKISIEQLKELKYLDRVIKESLRMWPSIPFVARQMTEDIVVGNKYLVPKGSTCMIFTHALHNNPKYYPKPEIFDPDRFLPENSIARHPFAYIPFSAGPRNCIGQKFAQLEVKVILAKVIRNYNIRTFDHRDKLAVVGELVLRSRNGLRVKLNRRNS